MESVEQLMYLQGIALNYYDYNGQYQEIPLQTRQAVLSACGHNISALQTLEQTNFALDASHWLELLPKVQVTHAEKPIIKVRITPEQYQQDLSWQLYKDDKLIQQGDINFNDTFESGNYLLDNIRYKEQSFTIESIEANYYQLKIKLADKQASCQVIASPSKAYSTISDDRVWGISVQLYGVRSNGNYGIGDFSDLAKLLFKTSEVGGDFIMLNPLHALFNNTPERASPYSPCDRFLLNPIYISPDWCRDFYNNSQLKSWLTQADNRKELTQLQQADWLAYSEIFSFKMKVFHSMYQFFIKNDFTKNTQRASEFNKFCLQHQEPLAHYYQWQVDNKIITPSRDEERFCFYLQWLAHHQLRKCQQLALKLAMKIGLMGDLAVGCAADGSEVARFEPLFVNEASIGAPPDPFSAHGQNWGLPPIDPIKMKANNYQHFIQLLRANMESCGALRIDHIIGLMRLWWCLLEENNDTGCYVYYPFDELFSILKLESELNQCTLIGEDLGIIPETVKIAMTESELYSNLLFYFEKDHCGNFRPLSHLKTNALLMIANHDVPPFNFWWQGNDIEQRQTLQLFTTEDCYRQAKKERQQDKEKLCQWLEQQSNNTIKYHPELISSSHAFQQLAKNLARSPVKLFAMQLNDFDPDAQPVNIPGTDSQYPNWRHRLTKTIDELFIDQEFFIAINELRRNES